MALLNRPLTAEELREVFNAPLPALFDNELMSLINEPRHSYVNYSARDDLCAFTPPEVFFVRWDSRPSDCVWMVPHPTPWLL